MADYNLGTASGRIVVDGSGAAAGFNVARGAAGVFFDTVRSRVSDVQQLGRRMAVVGTAGVAGFGLAVKTAASFEKQMSGVKAVTGAAGDDFDNLRKKALKLGADTTFSASEAALAIEELAKAGIPVEDILNGAADGAVALAAAGGVGLAEAATISANAMNQFGMKASEVTDIADILAGVANTSAADVSGIGIALSQAGAVANLAGLSFKDTAIAIGEMADAGINGSDAGTSLKTMLNNLIPTTDKQIRKFKELGILQYDLGKANKVMAREGLGQQKSIEGVEKALSKYVDEIGAGKVGTARNREEVQKLLMSNGALSNSFFDSKGNIKDLRGVQEELARSLKGMTKEQKLQTLETLFGADAMRASAILSLEGAKGYDEFAKSVGKTTAAEVAKTRLDNLDGAMEQFKGAMETARITIGSVFLPAITAIVKALTWLVNLFNQLPGPVQKAIAIIGLIASSGLILVGVFLAMLPVIAGFIANMLLLRLISTIAGSFKIFYSTLRAGQGIMVATQLAFGRIGTAATTAAGRAMFFGRVIKGLRAAFLLMMGPVGIVIAVVAALAAIGILLYNKYKPFRDLVDSLASVIMTKLKAAWEAIKPVLIAAGQALLKIGIFIMKNLLPVLQKTGSELMGKLYAAFTKIWAAIQSDLMPAIRELGAVFTGTLLPAIMGIWAKLQPLLSKFMELAGIVLPILIKVLGVVGGIFIKYVLPILIKVAAFLTGVLISAVTDFIVGIIKVVTGVIQVFTGLINFFKGLFTGNWSLMWQGLIQIVKGVWNLIVGIVKIAFSIGLLKAVGLGFRAIFALVRGGWRLVVAIFRGIGGVLAGATRGAFNFVIRVVRGAFRLVGTVIRGGWNLAVRIFTGARAGIQRIVSALARGIVTLIRGGIRNFTSNVRAGFNLVVSLIRGAWTRAVGAVRSGISRAVGLVRGLPGQAKRALGNIGSTLYSMGSNMMSGFINGVKSMASAIGRAVLAPIEAAKNAVKSALKIGSPSRVMYAYGKWTGEGYTGGVDSESKNVKNSAMAMAYTMINGFAKVANGFDPMVMASLDASTVSAKVAGVASVGPVKQEGSALAQILEALKNMTVSGNLTLDPSLVRAFMEAIAQEAVDVNRQDLARTARRGGGI